ncbi:hypothetical protein GPECTOR_114g304 [Gonium pectorale]|uniref:TRP C-terminal domain-containing protein n=1 Tax=Gonium pectorale TaxID=33097 RepID=A0A150FZ14_GONPE|nr:hypothetical protein GPECTOR_114g304 [Gonium pectorale]|eukprot:KXZ42853.1 hypothetical protein GPECTOR_114g304 [Gonium pectorale]
MLTIPQAVNSSFVVAAGLAQASMGATSSALAASFCAVCGCSLRASSLAGGGATGSSASLASAAGGAAASTLSASGAGTGQVGSNASGAVVKSIGGSATRSSAANAGFASQGAEMAAEWLVDAAEGTYELTVEIAGYSFRQTVVVDRTPPKVSGNATLSSNRIRQADSNAAMTSPTSGQAVVLQLAFSEPVPGFDPRVALLVSGAVITEWMASPDNTSFWVLALSTLGPAPPSSAPTPASGPGAAARSGSSSSDIGDNATAAGANSTAPAVAAQPAVQFVLPAGSYYDAARNPGYNDLVISVPLVVEETLPPTVSAALAKTTQGAAAVVPVAITSTSLAAAASSSFAQVIRAKGSMLQGSFHLQMLTMTMYLASPGIGSEYAKYATEFRYAILGVKGQLGPVDNALPSNEQAVSAGDQARAAAGDLWPANASLPFTATPPPPSPASASFTAEELNAPTIGSEPLRVDAAAAAARRRTLQQLLQGNNATAAAPPPPPPLPPPFSTSAQDIVYCLVIATILLAAVAALRLAAALAYRRFVSEEPHAFLAFPRVEMTVLGLVLVALAFYCSLAFGGTNAASRLVASLVTGLLVVPYGVFLWWLVIARAWMVPEYSDVTKLTTSEYASPRGSVFEPVQAVEGAVQGRGELQNAVGSSQTDLQQPQQQGKPSSPPCSPLPTATPPAATPRPRSPLSPSAAQPPFYADGADALGPAPHWSEFVGVVRPPPVVAAAADGEPLPAIDGDIDGPAEQQSAAALGPHWHKSASGVSRPLSAVSPANGPANAMTSGPATRSSRNGSAPASTINSPAAAAARPGSGGRSQNSSNGAVAVMTVPGTADRQSVSMVPADAEATAEQLAGFQREQLAAAGVGAQPAAVMASSSVQRSDSNVSGGRRTYTASTPGTPSSRHGSGRPRIGGASMNGGGGSVPHSPRMTSAVDPVGSDYSSPGSPVHGSRNVFLPTPPPQSLQTTAAAATALALAGAGSGAAAAACAGVSSSVPPSPARSSLNRTQTSPPRRPMVGSVWTRIGEQPVATTLPFTARGHAAVLDSDPALVPTVVAAGGGGRSPTDSARATPPRANTWLAAGAGAGAGPIAESTEGGSADRDGARAWHGGSGAAATAAAEPVEMVAKVAVTRTSKSLAATPAADKDEPASPSPELQRPTSRGGDAKAAGADEAAAAASVTSAAKRPSLIVTGYRRSDCRLPWLLPSERLMARFEFLFEDVLGPDPEQHQRRASRPLRLVATAVNYTHKITCAMMLGYFGMRQASYFQTGSLISLQAMLLTYLLAVWPYAEWQLQALELVCNTAELGIFVTALAVTSSSYSKNATLVMIACFFTAVGCIVLYEVRKMVILVREIWIVVRDKVASWRASRAKRVAAVTRRSASQFV